LGKVGNHLRIEFIGLGFAQGNRKGFHFAGIGDRLARNLAQAGMG
jgi:hypothetical protein